MGRCVFLVKAVIMAGPGRGRGQKGREGMNSMNELIKGVSRVNMLTMEEAVHAYSNCS